MTLISTKPENYAAWLRELRTTTARQCREVLFEHEFDIGDAFCCLGVGAKLAMGDDLWNVTIALAPREFIEWLGFEVPEGDTTGYDLVLDIPSEYKATPTGFMDLDHVGGAWCNDVARLTFPQIADMFGYFGVRMVSR